MGHGFPRLSRDTDISNRVCHDEVIKKQPESHLEHSFRTDRHLIIAIGNEIEGKFGFQPKSGNAKVDLAAVICQIDFSF